MCSSVLLCLLEPLLQVRKEDFMLNPSLPAAAQAAAMQAAGQRLLANMCQPELAAAPAQWQQQQQEQQQQQQQHQWQQQQQWQQAGSGAAERRQQEQQASAAPSRSGGPGAASPLDLNLITPGVKASPSPRIAAIHCDPGPLHYQQQQAAAAAGAGPGAGLFPVPGPSQHPYPQQHHNPQQQQPEPPPRRTPASPYDFPAESQIAAAALTMTDGDPAEAVIALLEKAMVGRRSHQLPPSQLPL